MQPRGTPPSTPGSSHLGSGGGMSDTPSPRGVQQEATICGGEQSSLRWRPMCLKSPPVEGSRAHRTADPTGSGPSLSDLFIPTQHNPRTQERLCTSLKLS